MNKSENPQLNRERIDMEKMAKIRKAIDGAFQVMKEYSAGLSEAELKQLARSFTGEPEEYFQDFFLKLKKANNKSGNQ